MPSRALALWDSAQQRELDRLEAAHLAVRGSGRSAGDPLSDAYIVLLAAHFQQFCRDLHSEAIDFLAASAPHIQSIVDMALRQGRQLDRGNATPSSLGADFGRLGLDLWAELRGRDGRTAACGARLEQLNLWRNAVAYRDFQFSPRTSATLVGTGRTLAFARSCRSSCRELAPHLDAVVASHLGARLGHRPW